MMTFAIATLTVFLILDCLFLGLLILIQLPKKEAGVGVAFGGGAADALFGAGSGTALSNLTKYTAAAFFVLVFSLSVMNNHARRSGITELQKQLSKLPAVADTVPQAPAPAPSNASTNSAAVTNLLKQTMTNPAPAATPPATNSPAIPPK